MGRCLYRALSHLIQRKLDSIGLLNNFLVTQDTRIVCLTLSSGDCPTLKLTNFAMESPSIMYLLSMMDHNDSHPQFPSPLLD